MRIWIGIISLACASGVQAAPKIAVTDLAYEAHVQKYVQTVATSNNFQSGPYYYANGTSTYQSVKTLNSYIMQSELRAFSGDIKGEILKSKLFRLVQSTPYTTSDKSDIYNVIKRIKAGHFKGADYVLFGTVSDIAFTQDTHALANTKSYSAILGLTLVANFSVINTRTLEVTSAFTAVGEGQNAKLVNSRDVEVSLNRPLVVREVAKTLGGNVAQRLKEQLAGITPERQSTEPVQRNNLPADEAPKILH